MQIEVDYDELIPNNVGLADDPKVKKALERWHPDYIDWWKTMGPEGFQQNEVYLRTAIGVDPAGWASFDYVKMPDYRWGILLAPKEPDRKIGFGEHIGEPVWQEVPAEYRSTLRRLLVIQGDTEPASVEQQRILGQTAPSLYDMRNLFQVNVEEGRHLWAMIYLLQKYFGKDGREEAEELLKRRSGNQDKPRILSAFNEPTADWLSFFMFTYFTDRDGKMQLASLAQSGFDPLSRTTRFMLMEEAHHMFVGESGLSRIIDKTVTTMSQHGIEDPNDDRLRDLGVISLGILQKNINLQFSATLDLFGSELSTNAANAYNAGLKGRYQEERIDDDHRLLNDTYPILQHIDGQLKVSEQPALNAMNGRLCDDYIEDAGGAFKRWNRIITKAGIEYELRLPHRGFNRRVGELADICVSPDGEIISESNWKDQRDNWLPDNDDRDWVNSLMQPTTTAGSFASWIAPPRSGVDNKPGEFEYVRLS